MKPTLFKPISMPLTYGLLMNYSLRVRVRREDLDYNFEYGAYRQHATDAMKDWDTIQRMMVFANKRYFKLFHDILISLEERGLPMSLIQFRHTKKKKLAKLKENLHSRRQMLLNLLNDTMFPHYYGDGLVFITKVSTNPDNTTVIIFTTRSPHSFCELWELEDDLVQNAPVIIVLNYSDAALIEQRNMEYNPYQRVIVIQNFLDLQAPAWVDRTIDDIVHGMAASQGRHPTAYDHLKCWADILGLHVHSYWLHSTLRDTIRYDAAFITQPFIHEVPRTDNMIPELYEELVPQLQENSDTESDEPDDLMQDPEQPEIHNLDAN
ncbi:unnamed protein product [Orchesella dallaii]|uniref:Uncharacterized protein n=1 Tax=Orchesella dallaii TaxID=48710 RepID=A0ABP1RJH4_9HEXA